MFICSCTNRESLECSSQDLVKLEESIIKIFEEGNYEVIPEACFKNDSVIIKIKSVEDKSRNKQYLSHDHLQSMVASYLIYSNYTLLQNHEHIKFEIFLDKEESKNVFQLYFNSQAIEKSYSLFQNCSRLKKSFIYLLNESEELDIYNYNNLIEILNQSGYKDQVVNTDFINLLYEYQCSEIDNDSKVAKTMRGIFLTMLAKPQEYKRELKNLNYLYNLRFSTNLYAKNDVTHLQD